MACRQKPEQPGKLPCGKPKKSQGKESTARTMKKQTTKQAKVAMQEGTATSEDQGESSVTTKKRMRKILNKKERESLVKHLSEVDPLILTTVTNSKLRDQLFFSDALVNLVDTLFADNHQLTEDIIF